MLQAFFFVRPNVFLGAQYTVLDPPYAGEVEHYTPLAQHSAAEPDTVMPYKIRSGFLYAVCPTFSSGPDAVLKPPHSEVVTVRSVLDYSCHAKGSTTPKDCAGRQISENHKVNFWILCSQRMARHSVERPGAVPYAEEGDQYTPSAQHSVAVLDTG